MRWMQGLFALLGVLASAALTLGFVALGPPEQVLTILVSGLVLVGCASFLAATSRLGALSVPTLVLWGYLAGLVWIAIWSHGCPGCAYYETTRRDAAVYGAIVLGAAFAMAMTAAIAGSTLGVAAKRLSSRAAPSG